MTALWQDVRFAIRQLRKHLGFTLTAVLTLAVGVGAATAVFSLVDAVLLRPLPFPHPEQLVAMSTVSRYSGAKANTNVMLSDDNSWPDFYDWRTTAKSFQAMAAYSGTTGIVGNGSGAARRVGGMVISSEFFKVLGVSPALGRTFLPEEELAGNRSVLLSDALWHQQFGGASDVVGKTLTMNERGFTVVGVMPASLRLPEEKEALFWTTEAIQREGKGAMATQRGWHGVNVVARLRAGVSIEQATDEMNAIQGALAKQYPESNRRSDGVAIVPEARNLTGDARQPLHILLAAVVFLLLIGCVNVAGLLLARATDRQGELAVRAALGASRIQIVRQLMAESLTLALLGGVFGAVLAAMVLRAAPLYIPEALPRADEIGMNGPVLLFALAASLLTGVLFGVLPAWRASRVQPSEALAESSRGVTNNRGRHRLHGMLVIAETAVSLLLLVGAGLLLRSFHRVVTTETGFRTDHMLTFRIAVPGKHFTDTQRNQFLKALQSRLSVVPGVQRVTYGFPMPMASGDMNITFKVDGRPLAVGNDPSARLSMVASNFFGTMGIPVLRGRTFTADEDALTGPRVLVVNDAFARTFFPGEDAIGKHITPGVGSGPTDSENSYEIVGVVNNVKRGQLTEGALPEYYLPYDQASLTMPPFALRVAGDPMQYAETVRHIVKEQDGALPVFGVFSYESLLERSTAMRRFQVIVIGGFAAIALLLAAIGLYAALAYMVVERTPELGLRLALGAQRGDLLSLVLRRGMVLSAIGLALGLGASAALTRSLQSILYATKALDAFTFLATALLLFSVCVVASLVPAWRASRLNPNDTLKQR